mmetsp:Transcript_25449/g.84171  ORF Transcript_25449/g.84171 Transcript_25449/m.84171 type:complete len:417 (-) Transcript_25449:318-1568(-)
MEDIHSSGRGEEEEQEEHEKREEDSEDVGDFIGSGVLPYCLQDNKVKLFLGKELAKGFTIAGKVKYCWSDFGGKREDLEDAEETALREFSEETLGLWGGMGSLEQRVQTSIANIRTILRDCCATAGSAGEGEEGDNGRKLQAHRLKRVFVMKNGSYLTFFLPLPYIDPLLFQLARDENDKLVPGAERDSDTCRCAEKRDWAWLDAEEILRGIEKGKCCVVDEDGQRFNLLPRLAVSFRSHLRFILDHLPCCRPCKQCNVTILRVPKESECRCLHLLGMKEGVEMENIRTAFADVIIEKITIYQDRFSSNNCFLLLKDNETAVRVKHVIDASPLALQLWDDTPCASSADLPNERVQYAWFEHGGQSHSRRSSSRGQQARRRTRRQRKLGVGLPLAPWASASDSRTRLMTWQRKNQTP